jgi:hypothetical protein
MVSTIVVLLSVLAALVACQGQPCNGFAELCGRKYSDITFAAAHNAAFVGRLPQHNQYEYPEAGMDMGIRYFTTQVHIEDGEIRQCHSDCALLNVGLFSEIVVSITSWLEDHPREIVTLLVTNGDDNILIEEFAPIFEEAGATGLAFVPDGRLSIDEWPTLGDLIEAGQRLVVFMGAFQALAQHRANSKRLNRLQCGHFQGPLYPPPVRLLCRNAIQSNGGQLFQLRH